MKSKLFGFIAGLSMLGLLCSPSNEDAKPGQTLQNQFHDCIEHFTKDMSKEDSLLTSAQILTMISNFKIQGKQYTRFYDRAFVEEQNEYHIDREKLSKIHTAVMPIHLADPCFTFAALLLQLCCCCCRGLLLLLSLLLLLLSSS